MINKKANLPLPTIIAIGLSILFWAFLIMGDVEETTCSDKKSILVAINGMKDMDTGFFAGGTTEQKNLLFNNGLLLTFDDHDLREVELYLNKTYSVNKCYQTHTKWIFTNYTYYEIKSLDDALSKESVK